MEGDLLHTGSRKHQSVFRKGEEGGFGCGQRLLVRSCTPTDGHSWMPSTGTLPARSAWYPSWSPSTLLRAKSAGRSFLTYWPYTHDWRWNCVQLIAFTCMFTDQGLFVLLLSRLSLQNQTLGPALYPAHVHLQCQCLQLKALRVQIHLWHVSRSLKCSEMAMLHTLLEKRKIRERTVPRTIISKTQFNNKGFLNAASKCCISISSS